MSFLRNDFGTTPIDPNEAQELIPKHMTTQEELNEWEQTNIVEAQLWLRNKKHATEKLLTQDFIKKLHQKMFSKTWRWAGKFRLSDKNIGTEWQNIPINLKQLFDDINFQIINKTYTTDEIATRFHHRLVLIHPFVNGNGRFSRLATDLFLVSQKQTPFSWGKSSSKNTNEIRKLYINSLKAADKHDYSFLSNFART